MYLMKNCNIMGWFVSIKGLQKVYMIGYVRWYYTHIYINIHILNNIALNFLRDNSQYPSSPTSAISTIRICLSSASFKEGSCNKQCTWCRCRRLVAWWCKCYLHVHSCSKGIKSTETKLFDEADSQRTAKDLNILQPNSLISTSKIEEPSKELRGSTWPASAACL